MSKTYWFYSNDFDLEDTISVKHSTKSNKSIKGLLRIRGFIVFELVLCYMSNLRHTEDYRLYNLGEKDIKYNFTGFYLTLFTNNRYLITLTNTYFYGAMGLFSHRYGRGRKGIVINLNRQYKNCK